MSHHARPPAWASGRSSPAPASDGAALGRREGVGPCGCRPASLQDARASLMHSGHHMAKGGDRASTLPPLLERLQAAQPISMRKRAALPLSVSW